MSEEDYSVAFNCDELRRAVTLRWKDEGFEKRALSLWQRWETETASAPISPQKEKNPRVVNLIDVHVHNTVTELKTKLDPKPWHQTLGFVTYDVPHTSSEVESWLKKFLKRDENIGAQEAIFQIVPQMRGKPDTDMYMKKLILPFRTFVVAQIVSALLEQVDTEGADRELVKAEELSALAAKVDHESSPSRERINAEAKKLKVTPARRHCALHAKDISDVLYIEGLIPGKGAELKQHIQRSKKQGICTRFAEYCLVYMTHQHDDSTEAARGASDVELLSKLKPLAEAGLAVAQCDVGMLVMKQKGTPSSSDDKKATGEQWLLRAANLGHTKAMLALSKLYLLQAANAYRKFVHSKDESPPDGSKGKQKTVDVKCREALIQAEKWLSNLQDAGEEGGNGWDEDIENDMAQGIKLREELRMLSNAHRERSRISSSRPKHYRMYWLAAVSLAVVLIGSFVGVGGVLAPTVELRPKTGDGDPHGDEVRTHNSKFRHRDALKK